MCVWWLSMCRCSERVVIRFFFFKQKTAYEMRISDWSSDVCSSDLLRMDCGGQRRKKPLVGHRLRQPGVRTQGSRTGMRSLIDNRGQDHGRQALAGDRKSVV